MLAAEALLRQKRLHLGRLTEGELAQLEPRLEPDAANRLIITAVLTVLDEMSISDIAIWKRCRHHLGSPMLQKVVDFDPTAEKVKGDVIRQAIIYYLQAVPLKDKLFPAASALHDWLGVIIWTRKAIPIPNPNPNPYWTG